jgi:hypothetical protein
MIGDDLVEGHFGRRWPKCAKSGPKIGIYTRLSTLELKIEVQEFGPPRHAAEGGWTVSSHAYQHPTPQYTV